MTAADQRLFVNARLPWRNLIEDCRVEALRVSGRVQRALGRPVPVHAVLCFTRALSTSAGDNDDEIATLSMTRSETRYLHDLDAAYLLADRDERARETEHGVHGNRPSERRSDRSSRGDHARRARYKTVTAYG